MSARFQPGDVIRHRDPYKGEHSYWISELLPHAYKVHSLIGKHSPKPDFKNSGTIAFENEQFYELQEQGNG